MNNFVPLLGTRAIRTSGTKKSKEAREKQLAPPSCGRAAKLIHSAGCWPHFRPNLRSSKAAKRLPELSRAEPSRVELSRVELNRAEPS